MLSVRPIDPAKSLTIDEIFSLYLGVDAINEMLQEDLPKDHFLLFTRKLMIKKDYNNAYQAFQVYKSKSGDLRKLSRDEIFNLYSGAGALYQLSCEELPCDWLLWFAQRLHKGKKMEEALMMLKNGGIVQRFKRYSE